MLDALVRGMALNKLQIGGTAVVAFAFLIMVMPDPWLSFSKMKIKTKAIRPTDQGLQAIRNLEQGRRLSCMVDALC